MAKKRRGRPRVFPLNQWSEKTEMRNGQLQQVSIKPNLVRGIQKRKTKYKKNRGRVQIKRLGRWHGVIDEDVANFLEELQLSDVEYTVLMRNYKKKNQFENKYEIQTLDLFSLEL